MGSIKISCIGDFLPADTAYTLGNGIGSKIPELITHYSKIENQLFSNSDIVFCNLEAPLILNSDIIDLPFAGNPAIVQLMKILNISVVSLANNHILDHGIEGFNHTTCTLAENGFFYVGPNENGISRIASMECKGKKIAFAGFNSIKDHPENNYISPLDRDILFSTLEAIKKRSTDYILYSLHWGNEYVTFPSPSQVDLAHELIDKGVNVIIGHHPHVVQPVENYNGGIIIYSLGNFLFDMFWSEKVRNGMQVDLILNENKSIDYEIKPYRIKSDFTHDYSKTKVVYSILTKAGKNIKIHQAGTLQVNEREYVNECRKWRSKARLDMKFFLLKNIFSISSKSRQLFFRNIKMKYHSLWKSN